MTELGKRLVEAREEKGMSLEDLMAATKIQKRYLLAIEQGNYDIIPGKFYVRAFIKQYAEAVGLNPEQLFEEFRKDVPSTYNDEVSDKLSNIKPQRELPKPASKVLELLPTILIIGGILVVIAIIYVIVQAVNHDSGQKNNQVAPQQSESKYEVSEDSSLAKDQKKKEKASSDDQEKSSEKDDSSKDSSKDDEDVSLKATNTEGSTTTYEVSGAEEMELTISASQASWLRVRDESGKVLKMGELKDGESFKTDLTDLSQVDIRLGNASGIDIKVNDETLKYELDPKNTMTQNIVIVNKGKEKSS
ncbi:MULTISPECIES: helix-turn-helix domain-containing protein [Bacillus]|uniref:helix-turn-helix domain-containing protein n=1 Tax=Bacillus TaxID=1386 RepID=UPI00064E6030|nr:MULTISPECIES: helix-turn-helix domain-containing protein [unclassified Bacillus (in: firmicutes)]KML03392.1 membrane protein [Bacillus stratosphericus]KML49134.1 membrane protein [Bacillus stratosphericus]MCA0118896.1 helix-turn-helix domain-containing protein [Bacillus sp. RSS_NA_20]TKD59557.1 helix-turn-helix domain-containing protein [Bacillus sp. S2(2019)]